MRTNFVHFHRYYLIIHILVLFFLPWPSSVVQGRVKGISSSNRNSNKGGTKARSKGGAATNTTNVTNKSAAKSAKGDSKSIGKGSKSTQEEPLSSNNETCFDQCFDGNFCNAQVDAFPSDSAGGQCRCSTDHSPLPYNTSEFSSCCPDTGTLLPHDGSPNSTCPIGRQVCHGLLLEECIEALDPCSDNDSDPCCTCNATSFCLKDECIDMSSVDALPPVRNELEQISLQGEENVTVIFTSESVVYFVPRLFLAEIKNDGRTIIASIEMNRAVESIGSDIVSVTTSFSAVSSLFQPLRRLEVDPACAQEEKRKEACANGLARAEKDMRKKCSFQNVILGGGIPKKYIIAFPIIKAIYTVIDTTNCIVAESIYAYTKRYSEIYCRDFAVAQREVALQCCAIYNRLLPVCGLTGECCSDGSDCDPRCGCLLPFQQCCDGGIKVSSECCPEDSCDLGNGLCCPQDRPLCSDACGCMPSGHFCCHGTPVPFGTDCCDNMCGGECYNPNEYACCDGKLLWRRYICCDGDLQIVPFGRGCDSVLFNTPDPLCDCA